MTGRVACDSFETGILPFVTESYERDGEPDLPARSEAWNNWTDGLCTDEQISDWQYENWSQPACCGLELNVKRMSRVYQTPCKAIQNGLHYNVRKKNHHGEIGQ